MEFSCFLLHAQSSCHYGGQCTRTSSSFKKVHHNMCARAINDQLKPKYNGDNVKHQLRTWQRKFGRINRLRRLSAAGWDEDNCIITHDPEHYANHVNDHKSDAEFLNKPLEHYPKMVAIFGSSMAIGKFAKGSNESLDVKEALGVDDAETEVEDGVPTTPDEHGATSSTSRPNKKAKIVENEDEGLIGALNRNSERLAQAIEKVAKGDMDLPKDLSQDFFDMVNGLSVFNTTHTYFYYAIWLPTLTLE